MVKWSFESGSKSDFTQEEAQIAATAFALADATQGSLPTLSSVAAAIRRFDSEHGTWLEAELREHWPAIAPKLDEALNEARELMEG